jgi:putative nucleotidyltransferase with HDIG domain
MTNKKAPQTPEAFSQKELKDKILKAVKDLPAMPNVIIKIQKLLLDPNSDTEQIAALIETDQAIAAKVLKMANSPFYGMSGKISSIHHAAVALGYKTLSELTAITAFSGLLGKKLSGYGYNSDELWKHSLAVALASKIIAEKINPELTHEALTAGLIHDIGKLILDPYVLEKREAFDQFMEGGNQTCLKAEKQILGFDHAEIAFEICKSWKFPDPLAHSIKYHHCPSQSNEDKMAFILHLADYIAVLSGAGYDLDDILDIKEEGTEDFLSIHKRDIKSISTSINESILKIEAELKI